jgi:hypothetical protein
MASSNSSEFDELIPLLEGVGAVQMRYGESWAGFGKRTKDEGLTLFGQMPRSKGGFLDFWIRDLGLTYHLNFNGFNFYPSHADIATKLATVSGRNKKPFIEEAVADAVL